MRAKVVTLQLTEHTERFRFGLCFVAYCGRFVQKCNYYTAVVVLIVALFSSR
jgi:hypothetical protein